MTATDQFDLKAVPWSAPRLVETRQGPRVLRDWEINDKDAGPGFWEAWRVERDVLRAAGYSVEKVKGVWILEHWTEIEEAPAVAPKPTPGIYGKRFDKIKAIYEQIKEETGEDYDYQLPHIQKLVTAIHKHGKALDASDTGSGKSFTAAATAAVIGLKLFVVCPIQVRRDWSHAAELMEVELVYAINYEMLRTGNTIFGDWQDDQKKNFLWCDDLEDGVLVVFDEIQKCADYKTLNSRMAIAAVEQGINTLGLSATAADNPLKMKFVAMLTGLIKRQSEFWAFMVSNGCKKQKVSKWGPAVMQFVGGNAVIEKIHAKIFPEYGARMRISELGDTFPETRIIVQSYDLPEAKDEINRIHAEMREEIKRLNEREADDKGNSILTIKLRARQRAELLKVPLFISMASDGMEEGSAVCVFVNFDATIEALAARLRTANVIKGGQDYGRRDEVRDLFNSDEENLILLNVKAGGIGIGLQGKRGGKPRLSLISPTYSGIDMKQVLGRPHRAGGAFSVQKILFIADTVEEEACKKVKQVMRRIDIFNEGLSGSELDDALDF